MRARSPKGRHGREDKPIPLVRFDSYTPGTAADDGTYGQLERGEILFFPNSPFELSGEDRTFLVSQKKTDASYHKNISYRPAQDRLKGLSQKDPEARRRMGQVMRDYSRRAIEFTRSFLPRYAERWRVDYASFRPVEEEGRQLSFRSRNDLLHVDSFPTRPSGGDRLLRIFTNVNLSRPRVWITSDNFEQLAHQYGREAGLPGEPGLWARFRNQGLTLLSALGLPVVPRSDYDRFMLRFHHFLKENSAFQESCPKQRWEFPPGSTWMVFSDMASHACLSGQFMLEQTFFVSRASLLCPEKAPISILENLAQRRLAD